MHVRPKVQRQTPFSKLELQCATTHKNIKIGAAQRVAPFDSKSCLTWTPSQGSSEQ